MVTAEISTIPVKGKQKVLFDKMEQYVAIMDRQRELGANKSRVIRLGSEDYSTAMRMARVIRGDAEDVSFKGYPIRRMGAGE